MITTIIKKTTKTILLSATNKGSSCTDAGGGERRRRAFILSLALKCEATKEMKGKAKKGCVNSALTLEKAEKRCEWWLE